MRVIILRPEPGSTATLSRATALGLDAVAMPLQRVNAVDWNIPPGEFDGLLIGSANALRHGGKLLEKLKKLPVHAVGETTAKLAREAGFHVETVGSGGLQPVIDTLGERDPQRLLRLSGEEKVALQAPETIDIEEATVYRLASIALDNQQVVQLFEPSLVLAHSVSALHRFEAESAEHSVQTEHHVLAALGPRIAEKARLAWRAIHIAERPDDASLLALAAHLCQE